MFIRLQNARYMQYLCAITASLSMTAGAMHMVWTSPSMSILQSEDSPLGTAITHDEGSWVVSLHKLGALPSTLFAALLLDRIGRKKTLLIAGVLLFIPWIMIIFATNIYIIYVARFISGIGVGFILISCSIYNAEIAENDIRGKLGSTLIIAKLIGSLMVLCIGPHLSYISLGIMSAIIPVVFLACFAFLPESPYYLMKVNNRSEAENSLKILSSNTAGATFIHKRVNEIEKCVQEDMNNKANLWEFVSNKDYRNGIIIIFGAQTIMHLTGESAIDGYMQTIIESSGSAISSELSSIIFGFVQLPAAITSGFLVDRIGRKPLLLISCVGVAVAMLGEGLYFYLQDALGADVSSVSWLPTVGIALFLIMDPLGIIPVPYVLMGELFPTNIKEIAVSTTTLYGSTMAFLVTKYFMPVANAFGLYTPLWFFGAVAVLGAIFLIVFLPETKGKSFTEIQSILNKKKPEDVENKEEIAKVRTRDVGFA